MPIDLCCAINRLWFSMTKPNDVLVECVDGYEVKYRLSGESFGRSRYFVNMLEDVDIHALVLLHGGDFY
jgi:hypothetical protein